MKNTKFLTVILETPFCYCDIQMYNSPGLDVGGFGDAQCFLGYKVSLPKCLWVSEICSMLSILLTLGEPGGFMHDLVK